MTTPSSRLLAVPRAALAALAALATLTLPAAAPAQQPAQQPAPPAAPPPANPADVASIDAIIAALYDVISGPAGQKRDWNRMRSLFVPGARLIPAVPRRAGVGTEARVLDVEGYIGRSGPYLEQNGFFERELSRKMEQFGSIAHVFSTYESRRTPQEEPFARGINSIQLLRDGDRWWIVTVYWDAERPGNPIPERYLK